MKLKLTIDQQISNVAITTPGQLHNLLFWDLTHIRIIVEEAKVNVCLRIMHDYKAWQYNEQTGRTETIRECLATVDINEAKIETICFQFEESLGMLLRRAFQHVETLQLMDTTLLIEHCCMVLSHCNAGPGTSSNLEPRDTAALQETVVMFYFSSIMKHAEQLNNTEILAKSKELGLIDQAVMHTIANCNAYSSELSYAVAEGFAALAHNEDFSTSWQDFFVDASAKDRFLQMETLLIESILEANPDRKKDLRPLLDFFRTLKRTM